MLSVLCPQCKSAYRVDETRIPPHGGVITCKQCQTRISIQAPTAAPVEQIEELTDADEVTEEAGTRAPPGGDSADSPSTPPQDLAPPRQPDGTLTAPAALAAPLNPPTGPLPDQTPDEAEMALPSLDISLPELGQAAALARAAAAASSSQGGPTTPPPANASPPSEQSLAAYPKGTLSAHQNAPAAHEIAPGASLYECPHCHKPFYLAEAKPVLSEAKPAGAATQGFAPIRVPPADGRKTVLVVDDQEFFRSFARDLLGRKYRVLEARTVSDAVTMLPECQLLVLDLTLDNEDGREVLRRKPPGVKCLIFSGQEDSLIDPAVFRDLQTLGADDMLFKSIAAGDALKEKVGRMLGDYADEKLSLD